MVFLLQSTLIEENINKLFSYFRTRLVKNSFYTGAALIFIGLTPFIFNFFIGRTFGAETLGSINIIINFCLIITIFISNFFGSAGNKYLAEFRGRNYLDNFLYTFKIIFFGSTFFLIIIGIILYVNWNYFFNKFSLPEDLLIPIIFYIFLRTIYILLRKTLYGMDLVKHYAYNEIFAAIFMFTMIGYVCYNNVPNFLIHTYLVSYFIFLILCIFTLSKNFKKTTSSMDRMNNFSKNDVMKAFSRYGLVSMAGTVASTGTGYLSVIVTGMYLNHAEAGVYTAVLSIVSILMFFPKLFIQVFLPEFSKLFGEGAKKKIVKIFKQTFFILFLFSSITCLILLFLSDRILMLFGQDFSGGSTILKIILPSLFIRMISIPCNAFLSGTKYILVPNIGGIIILMVSSFLWFLLVPNYNGLGIAIGYSLGITIGIGYQIVASLFKLKSFMSSN